MTMLQKLENAYLSILRFTVILIAGLLLMCAAFFTMNGLPAIMAAPTANIETPQITADEIIARMPADKQKKTSELSPSATATKAGKSESADEVHLEKIISIILKFVREKANGTVELDASFVKEVIRNSAKEQDSPELATAYLKILSDIIEPTLYSPKVKTMLQTPTSNQAADTQAADPNEQNAVVRVINKLLSQYRDNFEASLNEQRKKNAAAIERHAKAQANALISLYAAFGSFATFMLVVFMSIFIKIERNLRPIAS